MNAGLQKRLFVLAIIIATSLSVYGGVWLQKTCEIRDHEEPEYIYISGTEILIKPMIFEATARMVHDESQTGEKGIQKAVWSDAEADGGCVPQSDSGGTEYHGVDGESITKIHDGGAGSNTAGRGDDTGALGDGTEVITDELSAGEEDPGAGAETEAAFVPAPDVPAAQASAPMETAAAGVQVGAEIVLVRLAVDGVVLSPYLQEYLYGQLARYGCEWFFPVALCQIYQESRFRADAVNPNGMDKGLCQFREQYWEYHAKLSGLYEYDIWNPIDQLWVYAWLMSENLRKSGGDVGMALSRYYLGEATYCEKYVHDVLQWMDTMEYR